MKGHYRILLVDDDPAVLMAMGDVLESRGYEVVTARDGEEALENLKEEKPDLMILDLLMPRMDGFEVCKTLQDPSWSDYSNMPIMILTARSEWQDKVEGLSNSAINPCILAIISTFFSIISIMRISLR